MGIVDKFKERIAAWLNITQMPSRSITVQELYGYEANVMKNRILYRGDPSEIEQFFHQVAHDKVARARFWASSPSKGMNIRKIHSGLPSMIVNTLTDVVIADFLSVDIGNKKGVNEEDVKAWQEIEKENRIKSLLSKAVQEVLVTGDGAFKISFDTDLSQYPIIEFFSGEYVDYKLNRGRVEEIVFYSRYGDEKKTYTLAETYGKGYVNYELRNASGKVVAMDKVKELESLVNVTYKGADFILAVPFKVYDSPKWEGRGCSIFDSKTDAFDALDETVSQWQDAIRLGRIKRYIPESMIPRDPETGKMMSVNPLDNQFTAMRDPMNENGQSRILTEQPVIQYEGYLGSYINNLDMCLQGLISPSTLGIDTKKLDNAEAQREKEKTTLYTRQKILSVLQEVIPELVSVVLNAHATHQRKAPKEYDVKVEFGEYANPSFEAQVETVGKAATTNIMSIDAQVRTLWGDTQDDEWIEKEIERIKMEKGIMVVDEPRPHGFAPEEDMLDDMDRLDNERIDRDGARPVRVNEKEPQPSQSRGNTGGVQVDPMASDSDEELEAVKKKP